MGKTGGGVAGIAFVGANSSGPFLDRYVCIKTTREEAVLFEHLGLALKERDPGDPDSPTHRWVRGV
eukprot:5424267-Pyramimonas_sp.AAC.1